MRVTQNSMVRGYVSNLNSSLANYRNSMDKVSSGRKFTKMSESVVDGNKALRLRSKVYKNQQMQDNISTAQEELESCETELTSARDLLVTTHEQLLKVQNGTVSESDYQTYETIVDSYKDQIFNFSNASYYDRYLFGGTNASVPFELSDMGELTYNGVNVKDIYQDGNGDYCYGSGQKVPYTEDTYLDITTRVSVNSNSTVNSNTAFNTTVSGLQAWGFGTSTVTYKSLDGEEKQYELPNNVYQILDDMTTALKDKDLDKLAALDNHLTDIRDNQMLLEISDIGVKNNYLETSLSKLKDQAITLSEMQTNLECINDEEEIVTMKSNQYAWQLTLQFGSNFLPQSLMDYIG